MKNDETALASKYVAATNHYLESWGDFELVSGEFFSTACNKNII